MSEDGREIYSVVAGLDITFSTGPAELVVPVPLDTAFDIPNICTFIMTNVRFDEFEIRITSS